MISRFVCALLIFCAREFPEKSETREPGEVIVECTSYFLELKLKKPGVNIPKWAKRDWYLIQ